LRRLSFNVADMWCWALCRGGREGGGPLMLDVANVNFQYFRCWVSMLQTCDVGVVLRWRGGRRASDVGCCTQHESQHGSLGDRVVGRTPDVGCCTQHDSQHWLLDFDLTAHDWVASNSTATEASDASARNGRPVASSFCFYYETICWITKAPPLISSIKIF
jgi:hypothetical protein